MRTGEVQGRWHAGRCRAGGGGVHQSGVGETVRAQMPEVWVAAHASSVKAGSRRGPPYKPGVPNMQRTSSGGGGKEEGGKPKAPRTLRGPEH